MRTSHFFLVLGATGEAGQFGYKCALEKGHEVTIIVRDDSGIPQHDNLTVVVGHGPIIPGAGNAGRCGIAISESAQGDQQPMEQFIGPPRLMADATANASRVLLEQEGPAEHKPRLVVMNALGAGESRTVTPWITRFIIDHSNLGLTYEDHTAVDAEIEGNCGERVIWTVALAVGLGQAGVKPVKTFAHTETGASWTITRESCARWMVGVAMGRLDHLYDNQRVIVSN